MRGRWSVWGAVGLAGALLAGPVLGAPRKEDETISQGAPNRGRLLHGKKWTNTKHARRPAGKSDGASYALPKLIALVQRVAKKVATQFAGSILVVGDFSGKEGGPLVGHSSHQNGRDVDLGFYVQSDKKKPVFVEKFFPFDRQGHHIGPPSLWFDDRRNWALLEALLLDSKAEVRAVFVASWLKVRLLKQAQDLHAPKELLERAAAVLMQPPNSEPHHDHFHVRIACPTSQKPGCVDDSAFPPGG